MGRSLQGFEREPARFTGNGLVLLHHVGGEELDHRRIDVEVGQVYGRDADCLEEERGQLDLFDIYRP